jgi:hypothetical protein
MISISSLCTEPWRWLLCISLLVCYCPPWCRYQIRIVWWLHLKNVSAFLFVFQKGGLLLQIYYSSCKKLSLWLTWYYRNIILQRINSVVVLYTRIVLLLESLLCWWAEVRTMLRHLNRPGLNGITWALLKRDHLSAFSSVQFTMYYTFFFNVDAVVWQNGQFLVWELNIWQFIVIVEIKYYLNLNEYYLPIFILSIHFRQISFF